MAILFVAVIAFSIHPYAFTANLMSNSSIPDTLYVYNDLLVPDTDSLIIEPGTVVMFMGHYSIHVKGRLIAAGTASDSIIFTVADTTGFHDYYSTSGGWNGIRFEDTPASNDSSYLAYCRFEFGKAVGDSADCYGGAIRLIRSHKLRIMHSSFVNNYAYRWGGGIYALKSSIHVEHCLFEKNFSGSDHPQIWGYGGGMSFVSSDPIVRFCDFIENISTGTGGGIMFEYSNPEMINCVFTGNHSGLGGGISFVRSQPNRTIANVLVNNNTAIFFGGGISNITGSPQLSNFTIVNNYAPMGGGYYCNEYAHPKLFNSILWGNTSGEGSSIEGSQIWIWNVSSEPSFYNCNIQYGYYGIYGYDFVNAYENNIDADPFFTDPIVNDFSLQPASPCINAGTTDTSGLNLPAFDLAMKPRIIYDIVDMGAYEFDGPLKIQGSEPNAFQFTVSPNPVHHTSRVTLNTMYDGHFTFEFLSLHGKVITNKSLVVDYPGIHHFNLSDVVDIGSLPKGLYFLKLSNHFGFSTKKILVL